jgi:hypothetical protein
MGKRTRAEAIRAIYQSERISENYSRLGRGFYRRKFYTGKKGGAYTGKTRRGKGSKWMVVVDALWHPWSHLLAVLYISLFGVSTKRGKDQCSRTNFSQFAQQNQDTLHEQGNINICFVKSYVSSKTFR